MNTVMRQMVIWSMLLGAFVIIQAQAIELSSKNLKGQLSIRLSDIDYPAQFINKELDSGLPNTISLILSLTEGNRQRHAVSINTQVLYDLWDEVYIVKQVGSDGLASKHSFKTKAALLEYLGVIERPRFMGISQLNQDVPHQLRAQIIVNPVKTERIKKIQAWIASSNGFTHRSESNRPNTTFSGSRANVSAAGGVDAAGVASSGPRFQKLFDQILEQYINTEQTPALWRSEPVIINVEFKPQR